jgi:hypothetical protein
MSFLTLLESRRSVQALLILVAAAILCLPCLFYGLPPGYNAATHVKYQHHFARQFWNGDAYPRWLAEENKGFGSPIFLIQYPLPYYATALLRPITSFPPVIRETRELGLFCFLALAAAGFAAWTWLRKSTGPAAAALAAVVYMSLPYVLETGIYSRVAIGELCNFIWMPVALSLGETMYAKRSALFTLGGIFALMLLSNLLTAVLFAPVLLIYSIYVGNGTEPSWYRRAILVVLAQILGAGTAAIYLVPLVAYRRLFDLHQMEAILPTYRFGFYFLNVISANLETRVIALGIAAAFFFLGAAGWYIWKSSSAPRIRICLALAVGLGALTLIPNLGPAIIRSSGFEVPPTPSNVRDFMATMLPGIILTISLGFLAYCRVAENNAGKREAALLLIAVVSFFLMLPFSAPIWKAIPGSSVIQFPFRLGGNLCIAVAGLIALAFDKSLRDPADSLRRPSRLVLALAAFATFAVGFLTWRTDRAFRHPRITEFDASQDVDPMYRAYIPIQQLTGFAQDLGTAPDSYLVERNPPDAALRTGLIKGDCSYNVIRKNARELLVSSDCKDESRLRIGLLYSPLWKALASQPSAQSSMVGVSADGLVELSLPVGKLDTRLVFDMGSPGRWGMILSGASLLVGFAGFVYFWRRSARPLSGVPARR